MGWLQEFTGAADPSHFSQYVTYFATGVSMAFLRWSVVSYIVLTIIYEAYFFIKCIRDGKEWNGWNRLLVNGLFVLGRLLGIYLYYGMTAVCNTLSHDPNYSYGNSLWGNWEATREFMGDVLAVGALSFVK